MSDRISKVDDEEALAFHRDPTPGKLAMAATKPNAAPSTVPPWGS